MAPRPSGHRSGRETLQVLERAAAKELTQPEQIERQEFNYHRHGTINLLVGLTLFNGRMWAECLEKNDGEHFRHALWRLLHPCGWAKRIHLVMDNGSSHISGDTMEFFKAFAPRVHVLLTPANASWLINQVEALLEALSPRYLIRGSWSIRSIMVDHITV